MPWTASREPASSRLGMASKDAVAAAGAPPGRWLDEVDVTAGEPIDPPVHLRGFGGLHGGLTLALLAKAARCGGDDGVMRSATVRFHHPVSQAFTMAITRPRRGRVSVDALSFAGDRSLMASASLVTAPVRTQWLPPVGPDCPSVRPPGDCERFAVPAGLVPIGQFLEVRPTDDRRPYAGGARPVLTAWLRLTEDDEPPAPDRMIMLMDALAPSYAAILTAPQPIPTVELTVRCADGLAGATSPWILLRVNHLGVGGWVAQ